MKLERDAGAQSLTIERYGAGSIVLRDTVYTHSIVITADRRVLAWPPTGPDDIGAEHIEALAGGGTKIVLLGTGRRQQFLHASLLEPLYRRNIGCEVMDTGAACRSFNILSGEGRDGVCAALVVEPDIGTRR
jgi:uncharacterized protein